MLIASITPVPSQLASTTLHLSKVLFPASRAAKVILAACRSSGSACHPFQLC